MHEFSIASGLVEKLLDFAEQNPDKKIVEVRVAIGEFTLIEQEQLRFCYESIISEMPIAGSRLTIEPVLGKVSCSHCGYNGPPKYWDGVLPGIPVATLECPNCGKAAEASEGNECAIRSIRYQPNVEGSALSADEARCVEDSARYKSQPNDRHPERSAAESRDPAAPPRTIARA